MPKQEFGLLTDILVDEREDGLLRVQALSLENGAGHFQRILTRQAGHALWHLLGRVLFGEKGRALTVTVEDVPLELPSDEIITSHISVTDEGDYCYELLGVLSNGRTWEARLNRLEARRLWAVLDVLLYPVGWTGRASPPGF